MKKGRASDPGGEGVVEIRKTLRRPKACTVFVMPAKAGIQ
jgi:hypothetical protein